MRRARINYKNGYYHVMSRGYDGNYIFGERCDKEYFLEILTRFIHRNNIKLLAWCLMDNHYHLILVNSSGKLSKFMKELNGSYGIWYRKTYGGRGVVFDGRFKSTVIENEKYLFTSIFYLYQNPIRARLCKNVKDYIWSSLQELLNESNDIQLTDKIFINDYIFNIDSIDELLKDHIIKKCSPNSDRWGETLGSSQFRFHSLEKKNRRKLLKKESDLRRINDSQKEKAGKLIKEFLKIRKCQKSDLQSRSWSSSRLRGDLLLILRDENGMKLKEIHKLAIFSHYSLSSLGKIYQYAQKRKTS